MSKNLYIISGCNGAGKNHYSQKFKNMSNKEVIEFSEKLKRGLEIAERKMLEEKAMRGEDVIVSSDGKTFQHIPAKQVITGVR